MKFLALVVLVLAVAADSARAGPQRFRDRVDTINSNARRRPGNNNNHNNNNHNNNNPIVDNEEPLFPAFTATRATEVTQNGPTQIKFKHVITNEGAGFSATRGEFTAAAPGNYAFSWSHISPPGRNARVSLAKNDRPLDVHSWAEENGYQAAANTAVLNLRSGDRVSLRLDEGYIYEPEGTSSGYTTFTGYRIN